MVNRSLCVYVLPFRRLVNQLQLPLQTHPRIRTCYTFDASRGSMHYSNSNRTCECISLALPAWKKNNCEILEYGTVRIKGKEWKIIQTKYKLFSLQIYIDFPAFFLKEWFFFIIRNRSNMVYKMNARGFMQGHLFAHGQSSVLGPLPT